jgi:hypothetical protein
LFDLNGRGVTHDDDDPSTNSIQSTITGQFVPAPGFYYLAVTQYNRDPIHTADFFIWLNEPFNVERAPDGPAFQDIVQAWTEEPLLDGPYQIALTGADFATVGQTPPPPQENIWVETIDAGQLLPGQMTIGEGHIVRIDGALSNLNDVDLYCIQIDNPTQFHASTVGLVDFDTQLYLFDSTGKGVTFNDDDPAITGSWSHITGQFVTAPGTYYLAITRWDQDPRSSSGDIWLDEPSTLERIPDGPGSTGSLVTWSNSGSGRSGSYSIALRGAKFCTEGFTIVPPASFTMVRGTAVSGGLAEMTQSDNVYRVAGPGVTFGSNQDPLVYEFNAILPGPSPVELELLVESRGTSASLRQVVEVWDFSAGVWVPVNTSQLPAGVNPDLALNINLLPIPNVVGPLNEVRARLLYRPTGPVFSYPWRVSVDQVAWKVRTQ